MAAEHRPLPLLVRLHTELQQIMSETTVEIEGENSAYAFGVPHGW
jgi:hypothetical protein